jgi:hypothetical protein
MMPLPAYMNFWGAGEVTQGVAPRPEKSNDLANSLFGTFLDVDYRESQPKFVCKVCNFLPKGSKVDNVNYDYYIEKANRLVTKIATEGRRIKTVHIPNQLNLF